MHNFLSFIKDFRIPKKKELRDAAASFSKKEFFLFVGSIVMAFIAMMVLVASINGYFMVTIPVRGGTLNEGIIGIPTLVNPVLAVSDADKDVISLVYSGLMRKMPDGSFIPDLAESYTISPDGKTYTFIIKKNAIFQDGTRVTADDVIFTVSKIEDPLIKSPQKLGWDGVSISKTDNQTVVFTLTKPYISFMDNTTLGILPSHIWKDIGTTGFDLSSLNVKAIGSGPYQIDSVSKNSDGIPQEYKMSRFAGFTLGVPNIKNLNIVSFANEKSLINALVHHRIDQAGGLSPNNAETVKNSGYTIHTATLPRVFGLFFNSTNNKIFADSAVIKAFDTALDRQAIINNVLDGYATYIHNPVPSTILNGNSDIGPTFSVSDAATILDNDGWVTGPDGIRVKSATKTITQTKKVGKKTVTQSIKVASGPSTSLSFSITTGDTPELQQAALLIKQQLGKIGVNVDIKVYGTGELNQLIRTRNYEVLFFGQVINHESDLYSFWHSSQITDPGLNIGMYQSNAADTILQNAQNTLDRNARIVLYKNFVTEFDKDLPSLMIYSPKYLYATGPNLSGIDLNTLTVPSDRFTTIYTWYANVDHVWKIFTR